MANRLLLQQSFYLAENVDANSAMIAMEDNVKHLKRHLNNADTIIAKMIFTKLLSDTVDAIWLLRSRHKVVVSNDVKPISSEVRNFDTAMISEFGLSYFMFNNLDKHPEFWEMDGNMPGWISRLFFKPNMTINEFYGNYKDVAEHSELNPIEFAKIIAQNKTEKNLPFSLRNYVGNVLINVASPGHEKYIARIHDLNAKIVLLNELRFNDDRSLNHDHIKNPYYEKSTPPYITEDGNWVCFSGPLEDDRHARCLMIH